MKLNRQKSYCILALLLVVLLCMCTQNKRENITGIWEGKVQFPGFSYTVVFIVSCEKNITQTQVIFPDQSDKRIAASLTTYSHPDITLSFDDIKSKFSGTFSNNGTLIGTWQQSGRSMPIELKKVEKISEPLRPQTPKPPYPYNIQEVTFDHDNIHISGTLTFPKNKSSYPVVILIPGVGSHDRDNTFFGHRHFGVIADFLTRNGIAVLRYDERGVGSSKGDRTHATTYDFAQDVVAGVEYVQSLPEIAEIGLIGHSEGGTIASLVVVEIPDISFIIMMGSPGLKGLEYNLQFEESMGRIMGISEEDLKHKLDFQKNVLSIILKEENEYNAMEMVGKLYKESYSNLPEDRIEKAVQRFFSPWFLYNITYDPQETLNKIQCPILALFGKKDRQVPPEGNAEALIKMSSMGNNTDIDVKIIPGVNHYFQTAQTGSPQEYRTIHETISPVVLNIIIQWIHDHIKK